MWRGHCRCGIRARSRRPGNRIRVTHPQYPSQRHAMFIYEVTGAIPPIRFAAGLFSNGIWGFYVPS